MKSIIKKCFNLSFTGYFLLAALGCSEADQQGIKPTDTQMNSGNVQWQSLLKGLNLESAIIVQNNESIQSAIRAANRGDIIYIEPGFYKEAINIDKPDIKLIGLDGENYEKVVIEYPESSEKLIESAANANVEIINIMLQNPEGERLKINNEKSGGSRLRKSLLNMKRRERGGGIAHYQFEIRIGNRPFDVVRIHRIVRERRPFKPVRTEGAVFMLHGASLSFEAVFKRSGNNNAGPQSSSAIYLADNNIDVWGMDFAWTLVPEETSDFEFMKDWGAERDADHTLTALTIARLIRGLTRQGFGRINLLGYSYGVGIAYAAAGRETQQHRILRDIKGIIPVDQVMKFAAGEEANRQVACARVAAFRELINNGVYQDSQGQSIAILGRLAATAPDQTSPAIPGLTNFQAALFVGARTYIQGAFVPFWHFVGGDDNGQGGLDLLYTDPNDWVQLLVSLPPYMPNLARLEVAASACGEQDTSIDDHLSEISVPILYIGAGGGFGTFGEFTSSLTASNDITNYTISLQTDENRFIDYGHADLFLAGNADELVWEVLRQWLADHNGFAFQ